MRQFKDNKDRTWTLDVNVIVAKTVKDICKVNLLNLYTDEAATLFADPCLLVDVLYVMCQKQCKADGVTDVDFGESLVGDAIEHGATALLDAVADFFPQSRRKIFQKMKDKSEELAAALTAKAIAALDVDPMSLISATNSQGS